MKLLRWDSLVACLFRQSMPQDHFKSPASPTEVALRKNQWLLGGVPL